MHSRIFDCIENIILVLNTFAKHSLWTFSCTTLCSFRHSFLLSLLQTSNNLSNNSFWFSNKFFFWLFWLRLPKYLSHTYLLWSLIFNLLRLPLFFFLYSKQKPSFVYHVVNCASHSNQTLGSQQHLSSGRYWCYFDQQ